MNVEYFKKMEDLPLNMLVLVSTHYPQGFPISLVLIKFAQSCDDTIYTTTMPQLKALNPQVTKLHALLKTDFSWEPLQISS